MKKVLLFAFALISICATAQVYPLADGFETYTDMTELGTQGGYNSDMTVYPSHGISLSKGVSARMNNSNTEDSLVSPLIGPLTPSSIFSVKYRIMESASYPGLPATLTTGDKIELLGRTAQSATYIPIATIDETNHNVTGNFKKVSFSLEAGTGMNVYFMIRVTRGSTGDYFVDFDSLSVVDEIGGLIIKPSANNPVCHGGTDGNISLLIEGGIPPYTYGWSNTLNSVPSQSNLAAGTYSVTVWDNSGRSASTSITLTQSEPVTLTTTATNTLCNGSENGSINLTVHSGVAPFTYEWSNLAQTKDLSGLPAGIYNVVVRDIFNCSASTSQTVSEPVAIEVTETHTNLSEEGSNDASITVTATGGTWNYEYSLDGVEYSTSPSFNNLSEGCYTVRVKDSNNCRYTTTPICVSQLIAGFSELTDNNVLVYPNPASSYIRVRTQVVNSGEIFIANSAGVIVARRNITSNETMIDVSRLAVGKYILALKTERGNYKKHISIVR